MASLVKIFTILLLAGIVSSASLNTQQEPNKAGEVVSRDVGSVKDDDKAEILPEKLNKDSSQDLSAESVQNDVGNPAELVPDKVNEVNSQDGLVGSVQNEANNQAPLVQEKPNN